MSRQQNFAYYSQPTVDYPLTMRPRLSIIVCTYNRCTMVLSTLASLRRQTLSYALFEVVVVDNGSSDNTFSTVQAYIRAGVTPERRPEDTWRVQCLVEPRNGLAYARNKGLQAASGDIAVFLDDDARADPCFLAHLLNAYEATGADAIGGRVELSWDAVPPYWLTDDMLSMLGYFAPPILRGVLPASLSFSGINFSARMEVLRSIGPFSPFLSKRLQVPTRVESDELCQRLRRAGYTLWYDPDAVVVHRVSAGRLRRSFFVGRAYWQGRAEAILQSTTIEHNRTIAYLMTLHTFYELCELLYIALIHRPLLFLAGRSSNEKLQASMAQAQIWGHLLQMVQFIEHAPALLRTPAVLFVRADDQDASLFLQGLFAEDVHCTVSTVDIPFSWLWRHRTYQALPIAILHVHRPGAFHLNHWQRQRFWFMLWLAQCLGIRIVTTDSGGWWHNVRSLSFLARRAFERKLLSCSNIVLTYARQTIQLYPDSKLRCRVRVLHHPGFRGSCPAPMAREQAYQQLGIPQKASFVYLCLAYMHTEQELLYLLTAFSDAIKQQQRKKETSSRKKLQLLLVGSPLDRDSRLLKQAMANPAVHLFLQSVRKDLSLYMGAADTLVIPHLAVPSAGILETALLALSYERTVVAPDLPRFHGILPTHASILYDATSQADLVQALVKVQAPRYHLKEKDLAELDALSGWRQHAQQLLEVYRTLLEPPGTG